jgi:hypothetical protein
MIGRFDIVANGIFQFSSRAVHGQLAWHQVTPATMIGRAEQTNVKDGIARSFSCNSGCCDYYSFGSAWFDPGGLTGAVGGSATFHGYEAFESCGGYHYSDAAAYADTWTSSAPSVATVDSSGNVGYETVGTATIEGDFPYDAYYWDVDICRFDDLNAGDYPAYGGVTVDPPTCEININTGTKTTSPYRDNLSFEAANSDECTESLGPVECDTIKWWHGNIEGTVVTSDDASNWRVGQEVASERRKGHYNYSSDLYAFDDVDFIPIGNDPLDSTVIQNAAGTKEVFWIDGPGNYYDYIDGNGTNPINDMIWVLNLTTTVANVNYPAVSCVVNWHVELEIDSAPAINLSSTSVGNGWISTDF